MSRPLTLSTVSTVTRDDNNNNNNNNNNISLFYEDDILSIHLSNIWSST